MKSAIGSPALAGSIPAVITVTVAIAAAHSPHLSAIVVSSLDQRRKISRGILGQQLPDDGVERVSRYTATQQWHFVDIELTKPDISEACAGPKLPGGTPASAGPAQDCVLDKVQQFAAELAAPETTEAERILALKYLLQFIGDLHQPLHAADNHDRGGNDVLVLYGRHRVASKLHAYWDTAVVERIGRDEDAVATELATTFADRRSAWQQGQPADWAQESSAAARDVAYALPTATVPDEHGTPAYVLDEAYVMRAEEAARQQLAKAGFRLAALLNAAFH